ncbi:hypothetical protein, partial [Methylicorpusculum sp.]|uniref:hypothetical protein n=1 Tax=Methylicorpusculum sp. TaxID=2713644 RepID=UPI002AB8C7FB
MKKNLYLSIMSFACLTAAPLILGEPVITFFLQPYPLESEYEDIATTLQRPGKIAKQTLYGARNGHVDGILASYRGFLEVSDELGQISFPREHEKPELTILFTDKITPIMMAENTVHHWELLQDTPAVQYSMERIQDDTTKQYLWDVKQITLPENKRVGLDTLIIFVKPKNAYIPEGVSLTSSSPNLILPAIYIKKGAKRTAETLYLLNLKHLFGPIHELHS